MNIHLVVVHAFGGHKRGDVITDATQIAAILASADALHVVKVAANGQGS
jgi:hypothetical protein